MLAEASRLSLSMTPDRVVGKGRPRVDGRSGRMYTPAATSSAERELRDAWVAVNGMAMAGWEGPVAVRVAYVRPLAKSNPKRWLGRADTSRPDLDNVAKLALDALNGVAFADDRQVVRLEAEKLPRIPYGCGPRIDVEVAYYEEHDGKELR